MVVNSGSSPVELDLPIAVPNGSVLADIFEKRGPVEVRNNRARLHVPPYWVRLLKGLC